MANEEQNQVDGKREPAGPHENQSAQTLNLGRRRLVRGATAVAPIVLTLRSGALAAASCTGVKATGISVDSNNMPGSPAVTGDYCATPANLTCVTRDQITIDASAIGTDGTCGSDHRNQQVAILSAASVTSLRTS